MKYRIIKSTVASGAIRSVGDIVDVDYSEGKALMAYGKAVPHDESVVENRVEPVEFREPKPRGRKPANGR
jgi:hypothetical protein